MSQKKIGLSLSTTIFIGLFLGIAAGLFFGEYCAFLKIIGDGFIRLLQMTILPYITVSLILGIGSLSFSQAKLLAIKAGVILLFFWGVVIALVLVMPGAFPHWESAAFFSTSMVETPPPIDFLSIYIPSNPFFALANNVVPAVVLFSILAGIALMGIKKKTYMLEVLSAASQALIKVTGIIVRLTPIGVFAISASAAGTMTVEQFGQLQVYFVVHILAALLLTFVVFPLILTSLTPFRYRDIFRFSKDALVTGFTTGNSFVVLAVMADSCKRLFDHYDFKEENTESYIDVVLPVSFNFPTMGKVLALLFILFAAWFSGIQTPLEKYPGFVLSGLFSFFAGLDMAIPFMLDLMRIPADMYQLYVVTGIVNVRFTTLLSVMGLIVFTVLVTCSITGLLKIRPKQALLSLVITVLASAGMVGGSSVYFDRAVKNEYTKDQVIAGMQLMSLPVPRRVYKSPPKDITPADSKLPVLERIRQTGVIRVGYHPDNLPFSYFNSAGELVGLDVDLAQLLAFELDCRLEFIPFDFETMDRQLNDHKFDLIMAGVAITTTRLQRMTFSAPYMVGTLAFMVRDYRRDDFSTRKALKSRKGLKLGVMRSKLYVKKLQAYLPDAEVVLVHSPGDFLENPETDLDGLLTIAEAGAAWSLLYPSFQAVVPQPDISRIQMGYPIAGRDLQMADFMSQWIDAKKKSGEFQRKYDHWILGRGAVTEKPRWSVVRDVLGWVD